MFKLDLEKAEEPEIKSPTSHWIMEKAREFWKNIYFCFIDYAKAFDCVDLKEMGIPDHLTCLLRNLYADQEATVRTGHETADWFQIGKGVRHEKRSSGGSTSWNQDCQEKYHQPQVCK